MYTKGEYDSNLRRIMGSDIPDMNHNISVIAKYLELRTQIEIMEKLRGCHDSELYSPEDYKRDLKMLAERAGFKFTENNKES